MGDTTPLVSIIVCVYNAGCYLRPSVRSVLDQTYQNIEVLVVDDGSTDECIKSIEAIRDSRLRIIRQGNGGKPAALNRALQQLNGTFYAQQDADDISHPQRIERQVECMRQHPALAAVYCGHELILEGRHTAPRSRVHGIDACRRSIAQLQIPAHDPTGLFRISSVGDLRYDESVPGVEGIDYMLRVGEQFPMMVLGECLYSYRIHWLSITKRDPRVRMRHVKTVLQNAYRRRGLPVPRDLAHEQVEAGKLSNRDRDNNLAAHFMESVMDLRQRSRRATALSVALSCSRLHPFDMHYHKASLYALLPLAAVARLRRVAR